jgi:GT2 family glycosyltransferase
MPKPLVSVVIPTYNRAYCVGGAIDSVLAQSHQNVEIILIDDGSTDNTRDFVAEKYGKDSRVKYHYQSNGGVTAARNVGLKFAQGDYIALLDSDDQWKPWKLELQLECLERLPMAGMIWTDMTAVDPKGNVVEERFIRTMYHAYSKFEMNDLFEGVKPISEFTPSIVDPGRDTRVYWGDIFSHMVVGSLVQTSTVLLSRKRLELVKGFNEELRPSGEDYDFHLRTCREGPVAFIDIPSIDYRVGAADRLTGPSYGIHIAQNYLRTIAPIIERDRSRIKLPSRALNRLLSEAHSWIGREMLKVGNHQEARRHLMESAQRTPWLPGPWLMLGASVFPAYIVQRMLPILRHLHLPNAIAARDRTRLRMETR